MNLKALALVPLAMAWSALCFSLALHASFPSDAARQRIQYEVDRGSGGAYAMDLSGVSPWHMTGLSLQDVQLLGRSTGPRPRAKVGEDAPPDDLKELKLRADRVSARLRVLPLFTGAQSVAISADLYDGSLDGYVTRDGSVWKISMLAEELDLSRYPFEGQSWSADVGGRMRVRSNLTLDQDEPNNSSGRFRVAVDNLTVDNASVMGLTLGQATFSEAVLAFVVDSGRANVEKGSFVSELVSIGVSGYVQLNKEFSRSRLNLNLDVKLASELDNLAKLAPGLKDARESDGTYKFICSGTINRPSCREDRSHGRSSASAIGNSRISSGGSDEEEDLDRVEAPDADPAEAEARRRAREERIRERRQRILDRRAERDVTDKSDLGDREDLPTLPEDEDFPMPLDGGRTEEYVPPGAYPLPDEMDEGPPPPDLPYVGDE